MSCKKEDVEPVDTDDSSTSKYQNGFLCMNEGLFQQNNASLSYFSIQDKAVSQYVFTEINGRGLGDTANDLITFNNNNENYIAIAVDVSSQVEIIKASDLTSVAQIAVFDGNSAREPRHLEYDNGYLYSINFDGTVSVIDLSTYSIVKTLNVGENPDYSMIVNNQLFVVNSGGLNAPNYDNSISVIDLNTQSVSGSFETAINGGQLILDNENELYLISRGNYSDIDPALVRISVDNQSVLSSETLNIGFMVFYNDLIYYYESDNNAIQTYNTLTETLSTSTFIDCSEMDTPYGIYFLSDYILLVDAKIMSIHHKF